MATVGQDYLGVLERWFGERYSDDTVTHTLGQARRFLAAVGVQTSYRREDLMAYVDHLIREGYRPRSIRTILGQVKTLFIANGLTWPLLARDMHLGLPSGEALAPVLSPAVITSLIAGARRERTVDSTCLALSTVWGLRTTEIAAVLGTGLADGMLVVQAAKGGEVRRHTIPDHLLPYVASFRPAPTSRDAVHRVFDRVMLRWARQPAPREGWHAIRRAVVTGLVEAGATESQVFRFMGWHRQDMVYRYWRTQPGAVDTPIYLLHPYLRVWGTP